MPILLKNGLKKTKKWQGKCGVAIAMGSTGVNRGSPKEQHILAFFATELVSKEKAGLDKLVLNIEMM